jgi:hypothetical protein
MKKYIIPITILILILFLAVRVSAHHRPDHNPPVSPIVCEDLPSQNPNPHCQDDEPDQPVEPEQPTEPEQPVEDEIIDRDTTVITNCVHGDSMTKDVCDKFDIAEAETTQELTTEGK